MKTSVQLSFGARSKIEPLLATTFRWWFAVFIDVLSRLQPAWKQFRRLQPCLDMCSAKSICTTIVARLWKERCLKARLNKPAEAGSSCRGLTGTTT